MSKNIRGYIIAFTSIFIYVLLTYKIFLSDIVFFIASFLGEAIVPFVISLFIVAFNKFKNLGVMFGRVSLIVTVIGYIGNLII